MSVWTTASGEHLRRGLVLRRVSESDSVTLTPEKGDHMKTGQHLLWNLFCSSLLLASVSEASDADPIDIGNRLELFVDDYLIQETSGDVGRQLLLPEPREVVLETGEPWEGNTSGYYSVFQDGDRYRMVYRGWQHDARMKPVHKEVTCYAESVDGIHWKKPKLGLFDWNGSKENNIVWTGPGTHNFTAFRDSNPNTPAASRFRAFGGVGSFGGGLIPFESPDCIHWKLTQEKPVITNGAFDSQNLAFWDEDRKEYRAYWRYFADGIRAIRTATSEDFLHWENEADLKYPDGTPIEHLYTNAIQKYFRAPHLFIGFPTRYEPRSQQVEPILMTSRDGEFFQRYADAVIPRTAPSNRNHNRSNYMVWGMLQLPDAPHEISVYGTENYYERTPGRVRRFVYRVDGFVALRAGDIGGKVTTRPLRFEGEQLLLNYVIRNNGHLSVTAIDESGNIAGESLPLKGDAVDAPVRWETKPDFSKGLIQLQFSIRNADVFSLRFE